MSASSAEQAGGRRLVVLLAVVAVVMAAAAVTFGVLWWLGEGKAEREDVLDTAERYAVDMGSYDYREIKQHRQHILSFSTEHWAGVVKSETARFDDILVEGKAESKATVHRTGLAELSDDKAVVVLFLDQSITNTNVAKPRIDRSRMVMTLKKVDGEWLLDGVDLE